MLVPNIDHIIIETSKEVFEQKTNRNRDTESFDPSSSMILVGKVYAVGDTKFSDSPVMGDGRSFSWARKPDEFPLSHGEEVVCSGWEHATFHEGKYLFLVSKNYVLGVYRNREQVEATLFDDASKSEDQLVS